MTLLTTTRFRDEHESALSLLCNVRTEYVDSTPPRLLRRGRLGVYASYLVWQRRSLIVAKGLIEGGSHFDVAHHYSWGQLQLGSSVSKLPMAVVFGPVAGGSVSSPQLLPALPRIDRVFERVRNGIVKLTRINPLALSTTRRSSVTLAANTDAAALVRKLGGDPALLMTETVPDQWLKEPPQRSSLGGRPVRLIWVGRALPRKGLSIAIDVMSHLPDQYTLRVIGEGPCIEAARMRADLLGMTDRVGFVGVLPWDELRDEYDRADLLLFTSVRDSFGAQVLEAAARRLPVVGLAQHGVKDFLPKDAGRLVPVADPAIVALTLANAVHEFELDPTSYEAATTSAARFAASRTVDAFVGQLIDAYALAIQRFATRD